MGWCSVSCCYKEERLFEGLHSSLRLPGEAVVWPVGASGDTSDCFRLYLPLDLQKALINDTHQEREELEAHVSPSLIIYFGSYSADQCRYV